MLLAGSQKLDSMQRFANTWKQWRIFFQESQMKGAEEAGPELQATSTPPRLTSHFISKWRLTLICCVKPQKKKEKKEKPTLLLYKVKFLL